jgi:hypothetical protein
MFNTAKNNAGATKALESKHWSYDVFDRSMVLLNQVVEILRLPNFDRHVAISIDRTQPC